MEHENQQHNVRQLLSGTCVSVEVGKERPVNLIQDMIETQIAQGHDDAFYVADLGDVVQKFDLWHKMLSRVEPFYAVKCNDDPGLLSILKQLGAGFDCASQDEIRTILDMNVNPDRIIYAHPCKQSTFIQFAASNNVSLMTFDNMAELYKIKRIACHSQLLLRIKPPEEVKCTISLRNKFGCETNAVSALLATAKALKLNVVGVSFHVGSGCRDTASFPATVASARNVFDMGEKAGFHFTMLDIGGGFPGDKTAVVSFEEVASQLSPALDFYFPECMGVRIIAEPGRFFAASAYTLCVNVIAKRDATIEGPPKISGNEAQSCAMKTRFMYYMNDGIFGSFGALIAIGQRYESNLVIPKHRKTELYTSSVWGPTLAEVDCILPDVELPELQLGDWLVFTDMGSYANIFASNFNGMPAPRCHHFIDEFNWNKVLRGNHVGPRNKESF